MDHLDVSSQVEFWEQRNICPSVFLAPEGTLVGTAAWAGYPRGSNDTSTKKTVCRKELVPQIREPLKSWEVVGLSRPATG